MNDRFLILVRHGNTFEAGQNPVMVGAKTDLPLTQEGERQAEVAGIFMKEKYSPVFEISAGPLLRTKRFAEIICGHLGLSFSVDERLREIDYGLWEGLNGEEISARYGSEDLEKWEKNGIWPEKAGWKPSLDELKERLKELLNERAYKKQNGVFITSNGILRIIREIITGKKSGAEAKVKTGHICVLALENEVWRVVEWNVMPV